MNAETAWFIMMGHIVLGFIAYFLLFGKECGDGDRWEFCACKKCGFNGHSEDWFMWYVVFPWELLVPIHLIERGVKWLKSSSSPS